MRKTCFFALTFLLICSMVLVGCGGNGGGTATNPENVVKSFWDAFSKADFDTAANYVVSAEQDEIKSMKEELEGDDADAEITKLIFSRFKVNTTGHEIDGDKATVDAVLSYPDLDQLFEELFEMMFDTMFDFDEDMSEEEEEELFTEAFKDLLKDAPDVEEEITMELIMEDGEWKIFDMDDFELDFF